MLARLCLPTEDNVRFVILRRCKPPGIDADQRSGTPWPGLPCARHGRGSTPPPKFGFRSDFGFGNRLPVFGLRTPKPTTRPSCFGKSDRFRIAQRATPEKFVTNPRPWTPNRATLPPPHNRQVAGSSPAGPTIFRYKSYSCGYEERPTGERQRPTRDLPGVLRTS